MRKLSQKTWNTIEALNELLEEEHGGCDQRTCDISTCMAHGYTLWAVYLFNSCGAASDEFNELYATLPKDFYKHARKEADRFVDEVPHDPCPHCNAVVWDIEDDENEIHCDSCDKTFERTVNVIFRKYRKGGEILALFPDIVADPEGHVSSYQRIGQHGPANLKHCILITVPASPSEYQSLMKELEGIGYRLKVLERV